MIFKDGQVSLRQFWSALRADPIPVIGSQDDTIDAFRELYAEAVRCRMRKARSVGATLSGGLDSTSVCALAARELRQQGSRLQAFTSVPKFSCLTTDKGIFYDETPYVESLHEVPSPTSTWSSSDAGVR